MKKTIQLIAFAVIVSIAATTFSSCKKEADITMSFIMKLKSGSVLQRTVANTLEFNSGYVTIREIVFDGEKKNGKSVSITHEQVSTIDLITGVASPEVNVTIPAGKYNSVNLGIEIQDVDATPSLVAEGIYTDGNNNQIPLRFEFNSGEVFEANASEYKFKANSPAIAEIDFSPINWFSTITTSMLDGADRDPSGTILINESMNSNIFTIVADKLDDATQVEFK